FTTLFRSCIVQIFGGFCYRTHLDVSLLVPVVQGRALRSLRPGQWIFPGTANMDTFSHPILRSLASISFARSRRGPPCDLVARSYIQHDCRSTTMQVPMTRFLLHEGIWSGN